MDLTQFYGFVGIPVIVYLVSIAKPFVADSRLWPIISILLGVAWNVLVAYVLHTEALGVAALVGALVGMASSGAFSIGKTWVGQ